MFVIYLLHVAIALALLWALSSGRQALLRVTGFVLPLSGLVIASGVGWSWVKVIPGILMVGALVMPGGRDLRALPGRRALVVLACWAVAVTTWFRVFDFELVGLMELASQYGWGPAQNEFRHLVQLVVQVGQWLIFLAAFRLSASASDGRAAADGFIAGNVFSVTVGFYQAAAQGMGLPWLSSEDGGELSGHLGTANLRGNTLGVGPLQLARLYGLGGEPKHTAALAVMAIGLLLQRDLGESKETSRSRYHRPMLLVLLLGVALTLSTSGWVALVILTVVMTSISSLTRIGNALARRQVLRLGVNLLLGIGAVVLLSTQLGDADREGLLENRLANRLSSIERVARFEPKDATAITLLLDRPWLLVTGCGVGGVDFFALIYNERIDIGPGAMLTPTYFLTRTVSEVGVVGLAMVLSILVAISSRSGREMGSFFAALAPLTLVQPMLALPAFLFLAGTQIGPRVERDVG